MTMRRRGTEASQRGRWPRRAHMASAGRRSWMEVRGRSCAWNRSVFRDIGPMIFTAHHVYFINVGPFVTPGSHLLQINSKDIFDKEEV
jgi:hypothetical protein